MSNAYADYVRCTVHIDTSEVFISEFVRAECKYYIAYKHAYHYVVNWTNIWWSELDTRTARCVGDACLTNQKVNI